MDSVEKRLEAIELKLSRLEALLTPSTNPFLEPELKSKPIQKPVVQTESIKVAAPTKPKKSEESGMSPTTAVLGVGGVISMILAVVYLIQLAISSGWLTPIRQVGLAGFAGIAMIGAGTFMQPRRDRYATLLSAGGVVILYLALYAGHLYYNLLSNQMTIGLLSVLTIGTIVLSRFLNTDILALFGAIGIYLIPVLIKNASSTPLDQYIHFFIWDLVFCGSAIFLGRRRYYLIAGYLSFAMYRFSTQFSSEWQEIVMYQSLQALVYAIATVTFSIRHRAPLNLETSYAHAPLIFTFYFFQYQLLQIHMASQAPFIAVLTAVVFLVLYGIARFAFHVKGEGGTVLVTLYSCVVLVHAVFVEALPQSYMPIFGLAVPIALVVLSLRLRQEVYADKILYATAFLIFSISYFNVIVEQNREMAFYSLIYAAALYTLFWMRRSQLNSLMAVIALYSAHLQLLVGTRVLIDHRLGISIVWAIFGLVCMGFGVKVKDQLVTKSALLILGVSAVKVLAFDLSEASQIVRVLCLLILGLSLYIGGWILNRTGNLSRAK